VLFVALATTIDPASRQPVQPCERLSTAPWSSVTHMSLPLTSRTPSMCQVESPISRTRGPIPDDDTIQLGVATGFDQSDPGR
jgi:hypothetical protein